MISNKQSACQQATSDVALKINFNRTRRTVWDAKLGFQSCQGPLRVSLKSISRKGGPVGLVKVYLARVYPLRYMEKQDGTVGETRQDSHAFSD